jgi:ABC-type molybdenum transport system ATPase subunit/photorepair protein PhrA
MTTETQSELEQELRDWARGMTTLMAATEMLIRGGYAGEGRRWIRFDEENKRHWIDFASIPELVGALSGGERRFLRLVASLAADEPIVLGDEVAGLDHKHADLLLAGIAQAAGFTEPTSTLVFVGDEPKRATAPALYQWPSN